MQTRALDQGCRCTRVVSLAFGLGRIHEEVGLDDRPCMELLTDVEPGSGGGVHGLLLTNVMSSAPPERTNSSRKPFPLGLAQRWPELSASPAAGCSNH